MEMTDIRSINHSSTNFKPRLIKAYNLFKGIDLENAPKKFSQVIHENDLYDQLGLLSSVVAQTIGLNIVRKAKNSIPTDMFKRINTGRHVIAVANTEATGGTNLRFMKSYKKDGVLRVVRKYATNLGAADFVIVSFQDLDNGDDLKLALIDCNYGKQSCGNDELESFHDGMTGFFEVKGLFEHQYHVLDNSRELLQLCFNLERYLLSVLAYSTHQYLNELVMQAAFKPKFGEFRLIDHQFIQDKVLSIKENELKIKGLLATVESFEGHQSNTELSILKYSSIDMAIESVNATIECLGKKGLESITHLPKILADLYCLKFLGGSKELHKMVAVDTEKRRFRVQN